MTNVKRVLIYRLGSLGDTVVALPALHLVARAFPNAERRMLTNFPVNVKAPPAAAILENTGLVHGYVRYAAGTRSLTELMSLWGELARWRPEALVYLAASRGVESARRDAAFFRLCGVRRLIGVPLADDMQKNRWEETEQALEPEAARLARNIGELGDARLDSSESWNLHLTEAERTKAKDTLRCLGNGPVIAVSVGTKRQSKDWGRENWRAMLERVGRHYPGHGVVLCGSAEEREVSEYVADGWRGAGGREEGIANLCGLASPRETAAVLERCCVFVGHDSGPMHLAAAVQTPCVAVFSARNIPRVWFPYGKRHRVIYHKVDCWGCNLESCTVQAKKCLVSVRVDEVFAEVQSLLGELEA